MTTITNERPIILELVGVAGSGKSTLLNALNRRNPKFVKVTPPPLKHYASFLVSHFRTWFPIYLHGYIGSRWFTPKELRQMGYLETWLPYLKEQSLEQDKIVVLDPGCIFWLAALKKFGPRITQSLEFESWWNQMQNLWLGSLDFVIWLDAPSEVLIKRVFNREEWHEAKHQRPARVIKDFDRYRNGYREICEHYCKSNNNKFAYFKTDKTPTEEIADQLIKTMKIA